MEKWKQIVINGITYNYEVSTKGNIRNMKNGYIISQNDNGKGYLFVRIYHKGKKKKYYVHRLVATIFIPNPHNLTDVDHIDKNRQNNCVENLRWLPHKNNIHHSLTKRVRCVETGIIYESITQASVETGLQVAHISGCCQKKYGYKTCGGLHWEFVD